MKKLLPTLSVLVVLGMFATQGLGQEAKLQYYRSNGHLGVNMFETLKGDPGEFSGIKVRFGGASTLQFQGLNQTNNALPIMNDNDINVNELIKLENNFNLATANLDIDVQLERGLRMHLRTYMSSRHHPEPYVKGGYLQVDRLDFIREGFLDKVMDKVTFKVGHMENNYGDAHFRRSDNAMTMHNPFVGNYIMDGFTTEVGGEVYFKSNGFLGMVGLSNGKLNQDVRSPGETGVVFLGKLGFDRELEENLRVRLTGSIYSIGDAKRLYLYGADRTGSRYYSVMRGVTETSDNFRSGRWRPGFADKLTAFMVNPFVKAYGFEFFGTYENATGGDFKGSETERTWEQFAGELLYRFGASEKVYVGARYNVAQGKLASADPNEVSIDRMQFAFGWFLTNNVGVKVEYMVQNYNDFAAESIYMDGKFDGVMAEAVIAF